MIPRLYRNTKTAQMSRLRPTTCADYGGNQDLAGSPRAFVMNRPVHLPSLSAVSGRLPTPIKFVSRNVFPDHSLQNLLPASNGFTLENHLSIVEAADEVEVAAFIVDPGLLPASAA